MDDTNVKYPAGSLADQERATLSKIEADVAAGIGPDQDTRTAARDEYLGNHDPNWRARSGEAVDKGQAAWEQKHPGEVNPATGLGGASPDLPDLGGLPSMLDGADDE